MATSWSHSKAVDFETCKRMFFLKHEEKIPEPERPLPPGKTEHANDRGTRVHDACEAYVNGSSSEIPTEAEKHFGPELDLLRVLHAEGRVSLEGEWAMTRDWEPTGWSGAWAEVEGLTPTKTCKALPEFGKVTDVLKVGGKLWTWQPAWLRLKLDAIVFISETEAVVIDYKTGKKFGNEIKHGEQLQLYQLVSFLRYPKLEKVTAELWYLDQNDKTSVSFTRDQGLRFRTRWHQRGSTITSCAQFPPNPNIFSCRYCGYGPWGTGHCEVGKK